MSKRNATGSRPSCKRRKAGSSYATVDVDALIKHTERTEAIRVWDISASEKTGRVAARRKNLQHRYQSLSEPSREGSSVVEDLGSPADPEPGELPPAKSVVKHKRVKKVKENDSVRSILVPLIEPIITR